MPAKNQDETEIPSTIMRSEEHAQHLWKAAHDSAVETYGEGGRAHRVAYAALKHEYEKKGDKWVRKAENGPSDPQAARGPTTRKKSTDAPAAPTAGGKVAHGDKDARAKAKDARAEDAKARRAREKQDDEKKNDKK